MNSNTITSYLDLGADYPAWAITPAGWKKIPGTDPGLEAARAAVHNIGERSPDFQIIRPAVH